MSSVKLASKSKPSKKSLVEVVDLTMATHVTDDVTKASPQTMGSNPRGSNSVAAAAVVTPTTLDLTKENDPSDAELGDTSSETEEEDEERYQLVAECNGLIVGIRYYPGVAHPGEYVNLIREPSNPYDRNAIRVDNMHSIKVGHIKGTQARILATIMDSAEQRDGRIKLEATIPRRGNAWNIPCHLQFYAVGSSDTSLQERVAELTIKLQSNFYRQLIQIRNPNAPAAAAATAVVPQAQLQTRTMNWETQTKELDGIFDKQSKEQLQNLPNISIPKELATELLDYQKDGVKWLVKQEANNNQVPFFREVKEKGQKLWFCDITNCSQQERPTPIRGGILADEMGLGKTLQTIALILTACRQQQQEVAEPSTVVASAPHGALEPALSESSLKKRKVQELKDMLGSVNLQPAGKAKKILIQQCLEAARDGKFASSSPMKNNPIPQMSEEKSSSSTRHPVCTLIVCPVSVMINWQQQIETHVKPNTLRVGFYHGADRHYLLPSITNGVFDVLLVSYNTLSAEYKAKSGKKNSSNDDIAGGKAVQQQNDSKRQKRESLFDVVFHRVVLDEAHSIRNCKTNLFKAVYAIQADRKLCLTGTPFVNRSSDLHSLLRFLRVEPLSNQDIFRRAVTVPMQNGEEIGLTRLRVVMSHVALRRSKGTTNLKLTEKTVQLASVDFEEGSPHKAIYDALFGTMRVAFQAVLQDGDSAVLKRYTSVFEILLRLRQSCCSANLVPAHRRESAMRLWEELQGRLKQNALTAEEGLNLLEKLKGAFSQNNDDSVEVPECAVCLMAMEESQCMILRTCTHVFCEPCISRVISTSQNRSTCPLCRQTFQKNDLVNKKLATIAAESEEKLPAATVPVEGNVGHSPKILALLDAIRTMRPDEKGVVFSQFTSFLDLIGSALKEAGHSFTRLDGSMNAKKRLEAVKVFSSDSDNSPRFIICSLHAAGTGLNLTRGSVAFLMDCWWNQAVENQAMDRIHRLGQERDCRIVRFVMKGSVEERIVNLQEAKSLQAKGSLEKLKADEKRKARLGDLKGLLNLED